MSSAANETHHAFWWFFFKNRKHSTVFQLFLFWRNKSSSKALKIHKPLRTPIDIRPNNEIVLIPDSEGRIPLSKPYLRVGYPRLPEQIAKHLDYPSAWSAVVLWLIEAHQHELKSVGKPLAVYLNLRFPHYSFPSFRIARAKTQSQCYRFKCVNFQVGFRRNLLSTDGV